MKPVIAGAAFMAVALGACATAPAAGGADLDDPYETFNRRMFAFNAGVDRYALGPAARTYKTVTPAYGRDRITDFLRNLRSPVVLVNDILQGEVDRAATTAGRFALNTTFGVLGIWDVATPAGLERHTEDFGQTLAVWGVESGPYLILPIIGPTTPRDLLGTATDRAFDPLVWIQIDNDEDTDLAVRGTLGVFGALNARARLEDQIAALNAQPEPYIALRRIYSSSRQAEILNGRINEDTIYDDLPDFDAFDEFDDFDDPVD
ncbi:VacJ family lipoprotein [Hyphomonas sp.]|uniref:MlaA family lipoprotein n=1 Tax=Hyphomonas sp. TaxID=87 RepID=UPI00391CACF6